MSSGDKCACECCHGDEHECAESCHCHHEAQGCGCHDGCECHCGDHCDCDSSDDECHCACGHCGEGPSDDSEDFAALPPREPLPTNEELNIQQIDADTVDMLNGGIVRKTLVHNPEGDACPDTAKVKVHYTGRLTDGTVFDSSIPRGQPFEFELGQGSVIRGWDLGLRGVREGEKVELTIAPEYGYGKNGQPPKIPGDATLIFEVELLSFVEVDHEYPTEPADKIAGAETRKQAGNALFAKHRYERALAKYKKALELLSSLYGINDEQKEIVSQLKAVLHNNSAACQLSLEDFGAAKRSARDSITEVPSLKAYRRLCAACQKLGLLEDAIAALDEGIKALGEKCEEDAVKQLERDKVKVEAELKQRQQRVNGFYSNMFSALSRPEKPLICGALSAADAAPDFDEGEEDEDEDEELSSGYPHPEDEPAEGEGSMPPLVPAADVDQEENTQ